MWNPIQSLKSWIAKKAIKKAIGGNMFAKIMAALEGKKTYITALIAAILGLAEAYGVKIPEYVYVLLGAFGLGALRSGVTKSGTTPQ